VLDPRVTIEDLLLHVLTDFGVISSPRQIAAAGVPTRHQLVRALQHFLASLIPVWGSAIIVIDEAQDLDPEVLEQLRLLLNFEADEAKLLQIVLVGQPALGQMLRHASLSQLDDRVARRCVLEPLSPGEVGPYIEHRLSMTQRLHRGGDALLEPEVVVGPAPSWSLTFTPAAVRMFAARSRGIPRALNVLCDRALEIGYERRTTRIGWRIAHAAVRRVHARTPYRSPIRFTARAALAAAAVFILAVIGFGVGSWGSGDTLPSTGPPAPFASVDAQSALSASMAVKALPVADSFNLRVGSFRSAAGAADLAAQLEAVGLPAFVRVERGTLHQVVVGPYLSHAEITGVQSRLAAFGHPGSDVFVEYYEPAAADAGAGDPGGPLARTEALSR